MDGPLLLASNHPNSFLDAILLDILFKNSIWSLARGDVFKKPFYIRLLTKLKILPVYRTSEGVENLDANYKTFDNCKEIFKNKGLVLMFSEGKCVNEWHLRPLKKGTARLAISSWEDGIDVKVLPVGINYSSFTRFGKNIFLNFGNVITKDQINTDNSDGKKNNLFNDLLQQELKQLVFEIPMEDKQLQEQKLLVKNDFILKFILFLPALAGYILHAPLYLPVNSFTKAKAEDSDHHDSVIIALLVFTYPFYLIIIALFTFFFTHSWLSFSIFLFLPFSAWAYTRLKPQLD